MSGYVFLHVLSAEGKHSPLNAGITAEEYEESRLRLLALLQARRAEMKAQVK